MQIVWFGQSCFQILVSPNKGQELSVVIDPFSEEIGLKLPKLAADILLISHQNEDQNNVNEILPAQNEQSYFLIEDPGEYEVKNVFIQGVSSFHDDSQGRKRDENTIYTIEVEDLKICHLGAFGQKELTQEQLEAIGEVDILMIPVGGVFTISSKEAPKIMSQIEPKITIPMHYQIPKLKLKLDGVDKFLKTFGIKSLEPIKKLSIKKKDLSPEEAKIILLNP
jgi:L-ascorbate metabolism protein UlaG (beta-lactamase superfamily)